MQLELVQLQAGTLLQELTVASSPHLVASSAVAGLPQAFWEREHDLRVQQESSRTHPCLVGALLAILLRK